MESDLLDHLCTHWPFYGFSFYYCLFYIIPSLHIVVKKECTTAVRFLLYMEADVNATNFSGDTPLNLAAALGNKTIVEILMNAGARVNVENNQGEVALHLVQKDIYIAKILIDAGEKVDSRTKSGQTALHLAAERNQREMINYLLIRKADINQIDAEKRTALHYAAKANVGKSHLMVMKLLLKNGADLNAEDIKNMTPLHILSEESSIEVFELLLTSGADPSIENIDGKTPLDREIVKKVWLEKIQESAENESNNLRMCRLKRLEEEVKELKAGYEDLMKKMKILKDDVENYKGLKAYLVLALRLIRDYIKTKLLQAIHPAVFNRNFIK